VRQRATAGRESRELAHEERITSKRGLQRFQLNTPADDRSLPQRGYRPGHDYTRRDSNARNHVVQWRPQRGLCSHSLASVESGIVGPPGARGSSRAGQRRVGLKYLQAITRGVWCALALASTFGCRQIVGFDEPNAEAKPLALPKLPFIPAPDYAQKCEACARDRCSAERETCEDDAVCRELLRCYGGCSNPACRARCGSFDFRDDVSAIYTGGIGGEESPLLSKYLSCVGSFECGDECNTGRNWECNEDPAYRWPTWADQKFPEPVRLRVEFVNWMTGNGVPARVSARWDTSPTGLIDEQESDLWGQTELALPRDIFTGFLEVETTARGGFRTLVQGPPVFRPTRWKTYAVQSQFVLPGEPGRAVIALAIYDCLGFPAPGISFEAPRATAEVFYSVDDVVGFSSEADRTSNEGLGGFRDVRVEAETYTVIARRNGAEVARRIVLVRADWITLVSMSPREAQ
jgi:hypothetical protein